MKTSPNRCGGWNEYNHNIFVKIWDKYNGNVVFTSKSNGDYSSDLLQEFIDEVLQKIADARFEDIHSHIEWYSQYINLKMCQKKALDKWKENKMKIKKPFRDSKKYRSTSHSPSDVIESVLSGSGSGVPECDVKSETGNRPDCNSYQKNPKKPMNSRVACRKSM
ncbi:coiled-coil domain-containing protein 112-like [Vanessa cardui]|uniref:coiled-coil domain-containing protein 112-like n=1 Tax=Vanessa cardui TaxID=171605 RepID=UPI001F12AB2E|nr:coiled-coil domain-containing protein 112-like [Vanessa cardui]